VDIVVLSHKIFSGGAPIWLVSIAALLRRHPSLAHPQRSLLTHLLRLLRSCSVTFSFPSYKPIVCCGLIVMTMSFLSSLDDDVQGVQLWT
jgi:hypothetical protein